MSHLRLLVPLALSVVSALALLPPSARANPTGVPKVLQGSASLGRGQWRMELLRTSLPTETASALPRSFSMCFEGIADMTRPRLPGEAGGSCTSKTIEDKPTHAVIESICPAGKVRTQLTRKGKNAFIVATTGTEGAQKFSFEAQYTYEGPCQGTAAPIQLGADTEQCRAVRSQLAAMDPDTACADFPAEAQVACRAQMAASRAQLEGLCPPSP